MQEKDNKNENILSAKELPPLNERIKILINHYADGSVKRFSEMIKLSSSQKLNRIFNIDKRNGEYPETSSDILLSIANMLSLVSTKWLLTGLGKMIDEEIDIKNENIPSDISIRYFVEKIEEQAKTIGALQQESIALKAERKNLIAKITLTSKSYLSSQNAEHVKVVDALIK